MGGNTMWMVHKPRRGLAAGLAACLTLAVGLPSAARAQDTGEQLKAMYDDAVAQLKAAQDRKNELSGENDRLKARVAELEAAMAARDAEAGARETETADRTFFLRSHYAAWERFLADRPAMRQAWQRYLALGPSAPAAGEAAADFDALLDPDWPLSGDFTGWPHPAASPQTPSTRPVPPASPTPVSAES